ncbi:MAG: type I DNA topoisomerase [Nitrospirae bacterium]|nr:type I DNA topoisomerase [Nitrospirota bacterium]
MALDGNGKKPVEELPELEELPKKQRSAKTKKTLELTEESPKPKKTTRKKTTPDVQEPTEVEMSAKTRKSAKTDKLVIVESPAKANTIKKILGEGFSVKASVGHIIDLPKKELGVDTENGFSPKYVTIPGKEKVVDELRHAAERVSAVYLAPDPDREGEAIAWHISEIIAQGAKKSVVPKIYRVRFNEITERAVREAIDTPSEIDTNKVNAQQARRILDRLVGYGLSPLLWKKVRRGLSAGRVQSVAVRLVVDREREIEAFITQEYWSITGLFDGGEKPTFLSRLFKYDGNTIIERLPDGSKFYITSEQDANRIKDSLDGQSYTLKNIDKKAKKRQPSPPFITSTLQQEASRKLYYPAKKTMTIAQKLYEGIEIGDKGSVGLITYMRTDSTRIAPEAQAWAAQYILETFGKAYLPDKPNKYKVKANAQEAHEAIRPTYMEYPPEKIKKYLHKDHYALYELIWKRFIASQMTAAQLEQTTLEIADSAEKAIFRTTGTVIKFNGFLVLYSETVENNDKEENELLPNLTVGQSLKLLQLDTQQHFTQPPPRYNEASLVKTLEEKGIGRPSTYATIMSTIEDRKYVEKLDNRFKPTELGVVVNDMLVERFPELIDIQFTATMEDNLDRIEDGAVVWTKVIGDFYPNFRNELEVAGNTLGRIKPEDKPTEIDCDKCGKPMVMRWGKHGRFLACSGYPECKNARPLDSPAGDVVNTEEEKTDEVCDKCSSPMIIKRGRYGKFLACSNYPKCKNIKSMPTGLKCPVDGGDLVQRKSKWGKTFYSCGNYPGCKFASAYKPVLEACPQCKATYLIEKTDKDGTVSLSCSNKECDYKRQI